MQWTMESTTPLYYCSSKMSTLQASLGDAFAQALNQVQLGAFEAPATGKKGKKGKKNKGVVLLGGAPRPNM